MVDEPKRSSRIKNIKKLAEEPVKTVIKEPIVIKQNKKRPYENVIIEEPNLPNLPESGQKTSLSGSWNENLSFSQDLFKSKSCSKSNPPISIDYTKFRKTENLPQDWSEVQ
jgi:hypothetical protein